MQNAYNVVTIGSLDLAEFITDQSVLLYETFFLIQLIGHHSNTISSLHHSVINLRYFLRYSHNISNIDLGQSLVFNHVYYLL